MALINKGASLPSYVWAVTRLLIAAAGKMDEESARLMLTPPTLLRTGENDEYDVAVKTLADLGIVKESCGNIELADEARGLSPDDVVGFNALLRRAVLSPVRNVGIADSADLDGPKDLVRALAWFLTRDPATPLDLETVGNLQKGAFRSHLPPPIVNDVRWGFFVHWAPALGFAARSLLDEARRAKLVPDCTAAIRDTVLSLWGKGQSVRPSAAIGSILTELPVLPGGAYSRSLELEVPEDGISPALSNALLTGADSGWITLERDSDAADVIFLLDADGTRVGVSNITINGSDW